MNTNRSGTSQLSMSVAKFRAKLHEAFQAGQKDPAADDKARREFIAQTLRDMQWR